MRFLRQKQKHLLLQCQRKTLSTISLATNKYKTEQNVKESKIKSEFPQLCKFLSGLIFCLSFDLFNSSQPTLHRGNVAVAKLPRLLLIIASGTRDEGGGDDDVSPRHEVFDIFEQFCNLKQDLGFPSQQLSTSTFHGRDNPDSTCLLFVHTQELCW